MTESDTRGEPVSWLLVFHTTTSRPWLDWLIPGPLKHVAAACWIEEPGVWLFYEVSWNRTSLKALPAKAGDAWAARMMRGAITVRVRAQKPARMVPLAGWCVPAVKRLIGFRSWCFAPTGLYRDLARTNTAEIVRDDLRCPRAARALARGA